uniref:C2H2-type domain-containing protein n=1 Tax=Syphacia muris TaxID=451379 RepID=A0A0N5A837_9BILA
MDTVNTRFSLASSVNTVGNQSSLTNSKKWFSVSDELKRKGGYTQYNESFSRIGKYIQASEVGRFHFYCAACEADFSLAKMGPRAVERHVQSFRHKRIVASLMPNPQELTTTAATSTAVTGTDSTSGVTMNGDGRLITSNAVCNGRGLFFDIDTITPVDIFDVKPAESLSGVCPPLQSVLQTTLASNRALQITTTKTDLDNNKTSTSFMRCGGTANVICGSETDLSLAVKKELLGSSADMLSENVAWRKENLDKSRENGRNLVLSVSSTLNGSNSSAPSSSSTATSSEPTTGTTISLTSNNNNTVTTTSDSNSSVYLHDTPLSNEKEQQIFLLKTEILQMKKRLMRMKCEYYRKKIALVDLMKQATFCSS